MRFKDETLINALSGEGYLVLDGGMGSMLQMRGIDTAGRVPDLLNLEAPGVITGIHREYVEAGAQVITTNTFGANTKKLGSASRVAEVVKVGVSCARKAGAAYVAADIGPTGELFEPMGELSFDAAYELFSEQVKAAQDAGCDLFIIETMADLLEMKAAVLAVKEHSDAPIFATMTFSEDGHTLMGTTPLIAARVLDALGVNALGINCSVGPQTLVPFIAKMRANTALPVIVQPNAGLPQVIDGKTTYAIDVDDFIGAYAQLVDAGATVLGSCCGTTPQYTQAIRSLIANKKPARYDAPAKRIVTSARRETVLDELDFAADVFCLNEDGGADSASIADALFDAEDEDAALLKLVVDGIDASDIAKAVSDIQSMSAIPLWVCGDDAACVEAAVRAYSGLPLVSGTGSELDTRMRTIALHYGCELLA